MLRSYIKLALLVLARRKFFTFISLFGVSITLLALIVAAALFDHSFGPHAPETRIDRTLLALNISMTGPHMNRTSGPGYGLLERMRGLDGVERMAVASLPSQVSAYQHDRRTTLYLRHTDGEFWRIHDFDFIEGGPFSGEDDSAGSRVAVINESTRASLFGGGPALGLTVDAAGQLFRVVGVVRDVEILRVVPFSDVWVPIGTLGEGAFRREITGRFMGIFLARSRADLPVVRAAFQNRLGQVPIPDPKQFHEIRGGADTYFEAVSRTFLSDRARESHPQRLRAFLAILTLAFMTLPAINLVSINLSRILERQSEIGVRRAFGAPRSSLVAQFLVENLVLTLVGAALGLFFAIGALVAINRSGLIPYASLSLNPRIVVASLLLALVFALVSGVYPAWRMSRLRPVEALQGRIG